jgi:hypothetical protein
MPHRAQHRDVLFLSGCHGWQVHFASECSVESESGTMVTVPLGTRLANVTQAGHEPLPPGLVRQAQPSPAGWLHRVLGR